MSHLLSLQSSCCYHYMVITFFLVQWHFASSALLLTLKNHHKYHSHEPIFQANKSSCALFSGAWIPDDSYPVYQYSQCPMIDPQFNCQMYGRPDYGYLKYRWQPLNCDLPRFDGREFLMRMRGKTIMFVGDSLGRNQWNSLICMVYASEPQTQTQMVRGETLSTFKFLDYGVTVSYYKAPFLVDLDVTEGKKVLRLDDITQNGNAWRDADVLSFNSGHWWSHTGSLQVWNYIESGGKYYQDMDPLVAMELGFRTWAKWIDSNIDSSKRVFFLAISPTHESPSEWSTGAATTTNNCYGEKAPLSGTTYPGLASYSGITRVVDSVLREMQNPPYLLDVTILSGLRKDGHPSVYRGNLSPEQKADPDRFADCSHWCLPGLPDTWNQLLYTVLFS